MHMRFAATGSDSCYIHRHVLREEIHRCDSSGILCAKFISSAINHRLAGYNVLLRNRRLARPLEGRRTPRIRLRGLRTPPQTADKIGHEECLRGRCEKDCNRDEAA